MHLISKKNIYQYYQLYSENTEIDTFDVLDYWHSK